MMKEEERLNDHGKFKELCALANSGTLTASEWVELSGHLQTCEECREVYAEYDILAKGGIPILAAGYNHREERGNWDDTATRERLFARVRAVERQASFEAALRLPVVVQRHLLPRIAVRPLELAALAACFIVVVGLAGYRLGSRTEASRVQAQAFSADRIQKLMAEKKSADELLSLQAQELTELQAESTGKRQEIEKLRSKLHTLEGRSNELLTANSTKEGQLRAVSQQRDALNGQLRDAEQAYQNVQGELASLRAKRDQAALRTTSLESRI